MIKCKISMPPPQSVHNPEWALNNNKIIIRLGRGGVLMTQKKFQVFFETTDNEWGLGLKS